MLLLHPTTTTMVVAECGLRRYLLQWWSNMVSCGYQVHCENCGRIHPCAFPLDKEEFLAVAIGVQHSFMYIVIVRFSRLIIYSLSLRKRSQVVFAQQPRHPPCNLMQRDRATTTTHTYHREGFRPICWTSGVWVVGGGERLRERVLQLTNCGRKQPCSRLQ